MIRTPQRIKMIKVSEISPNPYQTRRNFNLKKLSDLSASIKQHGVLSPVILRGSAGGYEVICGQRRVRAAIMAGLAEVPAIVVRAGDKQCALLSMAENMHRESLSLGEEAEGLFNLMAYHRVKKERLKELLSLDDSRIREKMRFLSLGEKVRRLVEENNIPQKIIYELIKLRNEELQLCELEKILSEEQGYKALCENVRQSLRKTACKKTGKEAFPGESFEKNTPLYINTVKKTVQLLKNSGAKVEFEQIESENYTEFRIKTLK